ncbi:helix-turn-helix domain-containing protein [Alkalibacterium sp. f15]|uniref:helix-turn-helix domain-containing protein n=1 Tax=Alkalibacterium sp. f15 TaxID=3414029 RepID=UPI003BF919E1
MNMAITPETIKGIFKVNLRKEREERDWTIEDLAEKTGIYRQTLQTCENHGTFSAKTIAALCEAFNVDPWIFFIEEEA